MINLQHTQQRKGKVNLQTGKQKISTLRHKREDNSKKENSETEQVIKELGMKLTSMTFVQLQEDNHSINTDLRLKDCRRDNNKIKNKIRQILCTQPRC